MRTLLLIVALFVCLCAEAASPTFGDFDPTQFNVNPNLPPGSVKIALSVSPTNITLNVSYTTNLFSTNIVSQTINAVSNFFLTSFTTNLYASQSFITNLTVNYITINSNGIGPWIYSQDGFGTNTTIYGLTAIDDFFLNTTDPLAAPELDLASNNIVIAGFDGIQWFGNGGGLTNLSIAATNVVGNTNIFLSSLVSPTNGVSSATAIDFLVPEATTNVSGNIAFTSIINWNPTNYNYAIRHIVVTGGNQILTVGAGWGTDPILRTTVTTYTLTNGTRVDLLVGSQINFFTNANILIASP